MSKLFLLLAPFVLAPGVAGSPSCLRGVEVREAHSPETVTTTIFQPTTVYVSACNPPSSLSTATGGTPGKSESYSPQSSTAVASSVIGTTATVSLTATSQPTASSPPSAGAPSGGIYRNVLYFTNW
jgi:hypothetical protein